MEHVVADQGDPLTRIALALEQLVPPAPVTVNWDGSPAYVWLGGSVRPVSDLDAVDLSLLRGIDRQKSVVSENVNRLAQGHAAHDMLLWGSRGMGKSALVRGAALAAQNQFPHRLALVQVGTDALDTLPLLFAQLRDQERNFLVFIDDLGFADGDDVGPRHLRSWLEGGVEARPANTRLAVTSNRRAIVSRHMSEQDDPLNPRDQVDDQLALADRFGISLGFHPCDQDEYLAIISGYADSYGLVWSEAEALEWCKRRGTRSGRTAWQFITELLGRDGRNI